jgi:hypothetical protein
MLVAGSAVAGSAVLAIVLWAGGKEKAVSMAEAAAAVATQKAEGAALQAEVSTDVAGAADRRIQRERVIVREVARETERIRLAFDDGAAIEPAVAAWADGLDRLRGEARAARADADEAVARDSFVRLRGMQTI